MGRSEFRPYTLGGLLIPRRRSPFGETLSLWELRRTSQVPRLIFRHAPSPITPDSPTGSFARLSPVGGRLHHIRKVGHCQLRVTRPKRVRLRWARVFVVRVVIVPFALFLQRTGLTPHVWLPSRDRPRLHGERAIYMSDTFQSDRSARLGLAYRIFTNSHEYTSSCDAEDTHQIGDYSRLYKRLKTLVFIVIHG